MRSKLFIAILVLGLAASAQAALVEVEANDTLATATPIPLPTYFLDGGAGMTGHLGPADVDYISVMIPIAGAGSLMAGMVRDYTPLDPVDNDTLLGLFDPFGFLVAFNDDNVEFFNAGGLDPGFLSSLHWIPDIPGIWTWAISGYGDENFDGLDDVSGGPHGQDLDYLFDFSYVPEPATMGLLLAGAALLARRRR